MRISGQVNWLVGEDTCAGRRCTRDLYEPTDGAVDIGTHVHRLDEQSYGLDTDHRR
jgi:hypothetical protein